MRKRLVGTARCCTLPVHYFLLTGETEDGRKTYGVLVEGDGRTSIPDITSSRSRVQSLLGRLIRGRVTPVTALDVVEDWILA